MTSPSRPRLAYPARTKLIVLGVLAVATALFATAYLTTADRGGEEVRVTGGEDVGERDPDGVDALIPTDGSMILSIERVGIDLAPGWTGELLLLPGNGQATTLPEDEIDRDELNRITYRPGPGKAIERWRGDYCIAATIWDQVEGREATQRTENWCFTAT